MPSTRSDYLLAIIAFLYFAGPFTGSIGVTVRELRHLHGEPITGRPDQVEVYLVNY